MAFDCFFNTLIYSAFFIDILLESADLIFRYVSTALAWHYI